MSAAKAMHSAGFERHLAAPFFSFLKDGLGKPLMEAFKANGLDVRLRGNYLNAYSVGNSLAKVEGRRDGARLYLHRKFVVGVDLPRRITKRRPNLEEDDYVDFDLDAGSVDAYIASLPRIKRNAEDYATPEAKWEDDCVRVNVRGRHQVVLDRQIAKAMAGGPAPGKTRRGAVRLDVLSVLEPPDRGVVAVEIKRDLDPRIQEVPTQIFRYLEFLDPSCDGLDPEIAGSYQIACDQLEALGLQGPPRSLVEPKLPVFGLLVLANYNENSALLDRARRRARELPREIHFCFMDTEGPPLLPRRSEWQPLR